MSEEREPPKYVDTKAVAALLKISRNTVTGLCKLKDRPMPHVRVGRQFRFILADVEAWAARNAQPQVKSHRTSPYVVLRDAPPRRASAR